MRTFQRLLARITKALESAKIPYMVIGGQAVLVHGRPRFTGDIDITLGVDIDGLPTLMEIAGKLSLHPLRKDVEQFVKQTNVFPVLDEATNIKVDFIFSFSVYEQEAIKRAKPIKMEEATVYYATAEDVVIHKLVAGRPIDMADASSIINLQCTVDRDYIMKWLRHYSEVVGRDLERAYQEIEKQVLRSKGK